MDRYREYAKFGSWRRLIGRQFRKPQGLLGLWAARFMEKNNHTYYNRTIELLELRENDSVLEIGFGTGQAVRLITQRFPRCNVQGIDFSPLMLKKALGNNRKAIAAGRVKLELGDFLTYDFSGRQFDRIFCINVIYFWPDLHLALTKIHQLLAPAGRLVIYMSSPERLTTFPFAVDSVFHKYQLQQVLAMLQKAGFFAVDTHRVEKNGMDTYYLYARK